MKKFYNQGKGHLRFVLEDETVICYNLFFAGKIGNICQRSEQDSLVIQLVHFSCRPWSSSCLNVPEAGSNQNIGNNVQIYE